VSWYPCLVRVDRGPDLAVLTIGHPVVDDYLAFVGSRARPNTWLAVAFDLKVFFSVVTKDPAQVTTPDVFAFIKAQRQPRMGERVTTATDATRRAARSADRRRERQRAHRGRRHPRSTAHALLAG